MAQMDESAVPLLGPSNLPYDRISGNRSATAAGAATIIVLWPIHMGRICIILTTIVAFVCLAGIVVWSQQRTFQDCGERTQTSILIAVGPERKINSDVLCSLEAAALAFPDSDVVLLLLGSFPDANLTSVRKISSQYHNTQVKISDPTALFASSPLQRPPPGPFLELGARVLWLWSHGGWSPEAGIVPNVPGPQAPKENELVMAKGYTILGARHACQPQLYHLLTNLESGGGGALQGPGVMTWTVCTSCEWVPRNFSSTFKYCPSVRIT